jgi:hypothetical protein
MHIKRSRQNSHRFVHRYKQQPKEGFYSNRQWRQDLATLEEPLKNTMTATTPQGNVPDINMPSPNETTNTPGRGQKGRGARGGRGGRGRGNQGRGGRNTGQGHPPAAVAFKGDMPDMNDHVYQTFNESDDKRQFGTTTEALGRWISMHTKNSGGLMVLHTDLMDLVIEKPEPTDPALASDLLEQLLWKEGAKDYITRRRSLVDNLCPVYSVIWGQCSRTMKAKLMSMDKYEVKSRACECVWLLRQIKAIMNKFEGQRDIFLAMGAAHSTLECCKQQPNEINAVFFDQFKSLVDAFERYGGTIGGDKGLFDTMIGPTNDADHPVNIPQGLEADQVRDCIAKTAKYNKGIAKKCCDQTLAMMYL